MLRQREAGLRLVGLDRSKLTLTRACLRAEELGVEGITWRQEDFFEPETWAGALGEDGVIFSVHFHELMAAGRERMIAALRKLGRRLPGVRILSMEQPRLPTEARDAVSESSWLYSQSNVLIHHLIGNGRILSQDQWNELFTEAGGVIESCEPMGFLGYNMMEIRLQGGH
jgi:hypothetical protein